MAENHQNTPELPGDSGGNYDLHGKGGSPLRNDRMERMALRRWSHRLPEEKRRALFDRQVEIGISAESNREATQAFLAVLHAEAVDDELEGLAAKKPTRTVTNIGSINLTVLSHDQLESLDRSLSIAAGECGGAANPG